MRWEGTTPNFVRLDRNATFCDRDEHGSFDEEDLHPTHPHPGFGQLFNVFLPLQILEFVAELAVGTVVNKKQ
jgi:hypothetical protein